MNDDCRCLGCQLRRRMETAQEEMPVQEPVDMGPVPVDSYQEIQENLMQAQTVDLLTQSLQRAYDCNEDGVVAGIRRALDMVLPEAPAPSSVGTSNEEQTEPVTPSDFGASDFYGIPKEVSDLAKALAEQLGVPVDVMRFPKQ